MERGSKRKAAAVIAASPDGRASKRQRTPDSQRRSSTGETPQSTTEVGLRFIQSLKDATDNHGRKYTGAFLTLPSRDEFPDYYEHIKMPLAIDVVEEKLRRKEYPNMTALESDMKRLVSNAKSYNEKTSDIFADAERIRKMLGNHMKKLNPAYKDSSYVAVPTPIPEDLENGTTVYGPQINGAKAGSVAKDSEDVTMKDAPEEEEEDEDENAPNFRGKTFQEAQDLIVSELISYKEGDLRIYEPFLNLPPRSLTDYYAVIKQPTCLKGVQKKVRGVHGRAEGTGSTDLKSWDSFESEARKIWQNAQAYNEDGSDMYNLAGELEEHFQELLLAAKKAVKEPAHPTLKLNITTAPTSIKLRIGPQKTSTTPMSASPAPPTNNTTISVDDAVPEQQRTLVQGVPNSVSQSRPSSSHSSSRSVAATGSNPQVVLTNGPATSPPLSTSSIKSESQPAQPVPMTNGIGHSAQSTNHFPPAVMPPPQRPASGSPHPVAHQPPNMYVAPHIPHAQPDLSKWRLPGADASSALFNPLTISTVPTLSIVAPFSYSLAADARLASQSITISLPATHHTLLVTPTIRPEVFASGLYRLFVTANGVRVMGGPTGGPGGDPSKPVHEVRLLPGVNRIEVEMVAEPLKKKREGDGEESDREKEAERSAAPTTARALDVEKVSVFVQIMKS